MRGPGSPSRTLPSRGTDRAASPRRAVPSNQRASMDQIDHVFWDALLKKHVDDRGRVNYSAWKQSAADLAALDRYLNELSRADARIRSSRAGHRAEWINA